jgi:hypothetical protein
MLLGRLHATLLLSERKAKMSSVLYFGAHKFFNCVLYDFASFFGLHVRLLLTESIASKLLTPCFTVLPEKIIAGQRISCFYEARKSITVFTRSRHWNIGCSDPVESVPHPRAKILLNIFFPSSSKAPKWSLPLRVSQSVFYMHSSFP